MKISSFSARHFAPLTAAVALSLLADPSAQAASSNWILDANGTWVTAANWDNGVPGIAGGTNSPDVATFAFTLSAVRTITVDANRNIGGITFGNTSNFGYTLGAGSLKLSSGGVIQTASTNGDHTDSVSSAVAIQGDGGNATFTAGAASANSILSIGAVTGVSTGTNVTTLTLNGTNTGANAITGIIGNGAGGGTLAINKVDAGTWTLSGANTFTGGLNVQNGTLRASGGNATSFGTGTVTLGSAGNSATLDLGSAIRNFSGLATAGTAANQTIGNSGATAATVNYTGATSSNFGGTIQNTLGAGTSITSVAVNNAAAVLTLSGTNTYTGATTVTAGTLKLGSNTAINSGNNLTTAAAGTFDLGGFSTTLGQVTNTGTITNSSATPGTLTVGNGSGGAGTITGALNFIANTTSSNSTYTATTGFTNTGNITLNANGAGGTTITGANNTGTITNGGTGTASASVTTVGSNVTALTQNSATSLFGFTNINVNAGGTTITNNGGARLNIGTGITGTGNLILANNSANTGAFTFGGTAAINNAGTITNNGTGAGGVPISANIGSNVTGIIQNAPNSPLTLSGTNTFTNNGTTTFGLQVLAGTVNGTTTTSAFGTGAVSLGNTTGSANTTLRAGGVTLPNNITVQAGNTGTTTIGSVGTGFATVSIFSGAVTLNKDVTLDAQNSASALTSNSGGLTFAPVTGSSLTGVGGVTITNSGLPVSTSGQAYGLGGAQVTFTGSNTYQGDTRVSAGALVLSGAGAVDGEVGTSTNPIFVGDTSGVLSARLATTSLTGAQTLGRNIAVQAGNGGISGIGSIATTAANGTTFNGAVSLNKNAYVAGYSTFNGGIANAPGAPGAMSVTSSSVNSSVVTTLAGPNTYDGGTTVGEGVLAASTVVGTTAGAFGLGNVVVETGTLRFGAGTNIGVGKQVYVGSLGQISLGSTIVTQTALAASVDSTSSGAFGIGVNYSTALNLAGVGNGLMNFGADPGTPAATYTYSPATLGANTDGNYRLGWGGNLNTLILSAANVLTDAVPGVPSKLFVGGTRGFIGNSFIGQGINTQGNVSLTAANNYTGGTVVNSRSSLVGVGLATGSAFGSTTAPMTLHNSSVQVTAPSAAAIGATVGALDFDGASSITVNGTTGGSNTFNVASLTRNQGGTLTVGTTGTGGVLGSTALLKSGTAPATFATVDAGTGGATVAMLSPAMVDSTGNYLTYTANGVTPITTSNTTLTGASATAYVRTNAAATLGADTTISALNLSDNLTNSGTADVTLTVSSGGLNDLAHLGTAGANNGLVIGSAVAGKGINLNFGGKEAVIFAANNQNGGLTFNNVVSNTGGLGLTKSGAGNLLLASAANTFTGLITINQGALSVAADGALGDTGNGIFLNGGVLNSSLSGSILTLAATRTITLGEAGSGIALGSTANNTGTGGITVPGLVTGTGAYLSLTSSNTLTNAGSTATFSLTNTGNNFVAPIFVGANLLGRVNLDFSDDRQLGDASNTVTLSGGNSSLRYTGAASGSTARGITFYDQGGSIEVINSGVTLTDNGTISGSGMFNKNGNGTLALTGSAATFSGSVNVNAGVLNVSNADALGATTAVISGSRGVSGGAVYVQNGAALEVQGSVALGNAGGKTMYLNGSGFGNAGALRNVSGDNSNSGAVILQTNTAIGADAGSLTLSGVVSGPGTLTKTGAGMLALAGANTYTGATSVTAGTLLVNGSTAAASAFTVNGGATLGGVGTVAGPVNLLAAAMANPGRIGVAGSAAAVGTLTTGALTLAPTSIALFDVAGAAAYDQLVSTGLVNLGGSTLSVTVGAGSTFTGTSVLHLVTGSALTGTFAGINDGDMLTFNGYNFTADYTATGFDLDYTAVPEPGTWIGGIGCGLMLAAYALRRHVSRGTVRA